MHITLSFLLSSHNQAGSYKIEAVLVHSETVKYKDTVTGRERKKKKRKRERTNLKIYHYFIKEQSTPQVILQEKKP